MPLFMYKCLECDHLVEKFQHDQDDIEVTCAECNSTDCEKQIPFAYNRTWLDARDFMDNKIGPDAKRILDNIKKGKSNDFFDIYGEN